MAGFALAGGCVGVIGDVTWASAAAMEHHCYTYINLAFYNQEGGYTDGTCYDPGSRGTRANTVVIAVTVLVAITGAWLAGHVFAARRRRVAIVTASILSAVAVVGVVAVAPFASVPVSKLPPPWWPGPVTPPIWLLPLSLIVAFTVAALGAVVSARAVWIVSAVVVVAGIAAADPVAVAWQRQQDRTVCPEIADRPAPNVLVWC